MLRAALTLYRERADSLVLAYVDPDNAGEEVALPAGDYVLDLPGEQSVAGTVAGALVGFAIPEVTADAGPYDAEISYTPPGGDPQVWGVLSLSLLDAPSSYA